MAYNMTALQDVSTVYQLIDYANSQTGSVLIGLFTIAIFVILLMTLKRYDFGNALLATSFITTVISLLFGYIGLISFYFSLVYAIITAGTAMYVTMRGS